MNKYTYTADRMMAYGDSHPAQPIARVALFRDGYMVETLLVNDDGYLNREVDVWLRNNR